jgi:hypothetical protein
MGERRRRIGAWADFSPTDSRYPRDYVKSAGSALALADAFGPWSAMSVDAARHVLSAAANCAEARFIYHFGLLSGLALRSATSLLRHLIPKAFRLTQAAGLKACFAYVNASAFRD